MNTQEVPFQELQELIKTLLGPNGCSWDKEQTPLTLCDYLVEEAHELADAIRHGTHADICEEMGDVFFLLFFLGHLYEERGNFTLNQAVSASVTKMMRRHPHVFSDTAFASREEQLQTWEKIKRAEHSAEDGTPASVFASLPKGLPPLIKAYRVHSKAARAGFTWDTDQDVEQQVEAEWLELLDTFASDDKDAQERELGDALFTLVELGRRKGLKANAALDGATQRFVTRFQFMEDKARNAGKDFTALSMEEKNDLWEEAKKETA